MFADSKEKTSRLAEFGEKIVKEVRNNWFYFQLHIRERERVRDVCVKMGMRIGIYFFCPVISIFMRLRLHLC